MPFLHKLNFRPIVAFSATLGVAAITLAGYRPAAPDTANPPITPDQATFFENKVRPLLADNCYSCHGPDAQLGGLRLDSRAALLKGGVSGSSLSLATPDKSLLLTAVHQTGALKMPQGGKLKPDEIATLDAWVKMGAPWPEKSVSSADAAAKPGSEPWRSFWSLVPVKMPVIPAVKAKALIKTPVDNFVFAKVEASGLAPAPAADRRTLLRRVTFDLIGLPPTPGEMDDFLADKSPNAYEKVVDRLLASPRYGERWGRHWLDVARYADTKGYVFVEDRNYPYAYTYRDWVIRSFNEDLPYDQFIVDQLAADQLPEVKNSDDKRPLAAMGYLTLGRRFLNSQPDIIDDRIDVTMRGFEGLTVACARCHDHKFDPIPTADYYSLYGVFASSQESSPPISPPAISAPFEKHRAAVIAAQNEIDGLIRAEVTRIREAQAHPAPGAAPLADPVKKSLQAVRTEALPAGENLKNIETVFTPDAATKLAGLRQNLDTLNKNAPPQPELAMAMDDKPKPEQAFIFKRGNPGNHGDAVPRRFPVCLTDPSKPREEWTKDSGRLELARAIASKDNPRTARVFVNRVWMYHFGSGIVRTPSDFGKQGERPTNPELLDYLASQFMQDGWSIKKLQKLIVLSATYRESSTASAKSLTVDPENRLLSHQNRRRLDLEQMRDSLLWAAGDLDVSKVGGPSVQLWDAPFTTRRAVYGFVERQNLPGTFRTFDFATPDATNAQRFQTTIPQQALFFMNSPFAAQQATLLSERDGISETTDRDEARRIRRLYLRLYGRLPDADETQDAIEYMNAPDPDSNVPIAAPPAWQYGFGGFDPVTARTVGFTAFAQFKGDHYQPDSEIPSTQQPLGYVSLTPTGGHPGRDAMHAAVRRWVAPADMTVMIGTILKHPNANGDGVRARIVSSRAGLLGEWTAHNSEARTVVPTLTVHKGETIDFLVDCITNDAFDSFAYAPTIHQIGGPGVWSAEQEFSGPPPPEKRLSRWQRYCQALLMTNEFLFVD